MHSFGIIITALATIGCVSARAVRRQDQDVTVWVTSETDHCLIVPKYEYTNVGDSEYPGGMQSYCTSPAYPAQGTLPSDFWSRVTLARGNGQGAYVQLTGCIRPETLDRLNSDDSGGQYDSNGGEGGLGNPQNSACLGYSSYVELLEPAGNRACIRCCENPADCRIDLDTSGCQTVIPGDYEGCGY